MSKDNSLLVSHCPLCEIFLNPEENIRTKLYYPDSIEKVYESDFVIIDCESCKTPLVVPNQHVTEVHKELWGKILRECRGLFGKGMRLKLKMLTCRDHWHAHLMK